MRYVVAAFWSTARPLRRRAAPPARSPRPKTPKQEPQPLRKAA